RELHRSGYSLSRSQRRPGLQAQRGLFLPGRDGQSGRDGPLLERDRRQWRLGERVRLVQGPLGPQLADHPARADRRACSWWRRGKACLRGDDADEEDRRRRHRGRAAGLTSFFRVAQERNTATELIDVQREQLLNREL